MGGPASGPPRRYVATVAQVPVARVGRGLEGVTTQWLTLGTGHSQPVAVDVSPCRFGGTRAWWRCPGCAKRCMRLHLVRGRWSCRRCARLAYPSQREDLGGRGERKARKALQKLGVDTSEGLGGDWGERPKGMHRRTFERLQERLGDAEAMRDAHLFNAAKALGARVGRR